MCGSTIVRKGGLEDAPAEARAALPAGSEEHRFIIKSDGAAVLHGVGSSDLAWNFTAIPDRAPTIDLIKDPERQARGSLRLDYKMDDDYGVVEAHAEFALKDGDADGEKSTHPLYGPPEFPLTLPQARTRSGAAQTTRDLSEHPWAGAKVTVTLVARDEAGNEGRSEPTEFQLPQRIFVKPVARALIEQRRILALDARGKAPCADGARHAHDRAGTFYTRDRGLSRPALDLLRSRPRQERRPVARGRGAHVGHGDAA